MIQALATYRFSMVISQGPRGTKRPAQDAYCETMGWKHGTYKRKVQVGSVIANNPGLDYQGKTDNEILDSAGLLPASRKKVAGNQLPIPKTPPNSAIFKAEIMRLKDEVQRLEDLVDEISGERDQYQAAYDSVVETNQSLQETINEYQEEG